MVGILFMVGGALFTAVLMWLAFLPARRSARSEAGRRYVEPGRGIRIVAVVLLAVDAFGFYAMAMSWPPVDNQLTAFYAVLAMLGLTAAIVVYVAFIARIAYDDNYVFLYFLTKWNRRIPWSSITGFEYVDSARCWTIEAVESGKFSIYPWLSGYAEFLDTAHEKLLSAENQRKREQHRRSPSADGDEQTGNARNRIRPGMAHYAIILVSGSAAAALAYALIVDDVPDPLEELAFLALAIGSGLWFVIMTLSLCFFEFTYDDDAISCRTWYRGRRRIPWSSVTGFRFAGDGRIFRLTADNVRRISVDRTQDGYRRFVEFTLWRLGALNDSEST